MTMRITAERMLWVVVIATIVENVFPSYVSLGWFCTNLIWLCQE
jgi:hypothetical protein